VTAARKSREPLDPLNLARRPFANGRPVVRVSVLLGLLGAALLVANVAGYWRYLAESEAKRAERDALSAQREQVERRIGDLARQLQSFDLDRQNQQVVFLNQRIAERTFSWSTLLDRLARELPSDVRLLSLAPTSNSARSRTLTSSAAKKPAAGDRIPLTIDGEAKSVQAMLQFVDHLFARAEFVDPNPQNQQEDEKGLIKFRMSVDYLPLVAAGEMAVPSASASPGAGGTAKPAALTTAVGGGR
jgi:Tfp pilus assembly protein PilN